MAEVERSRIVPYSAEEMYALVDEVEAYPTFLSWCGSVEIHERTNQLLRARIEFAQAGFSQKFTTLSRLQQGRSIAMEVLDGPFSELSGLWQFDDRSPGDSEVSFHIRFEFAGLIMGALIGPAFERTCFSLIDSFADRAIEIYGRR